MAQKKKQSTFISIITVIAAIVVWYFNQNKAVDDTTFCADELTEVKITTNRFQVLKNCTLIEHQHNDGDSFHIQHPDGKDEIRLYFVDTPESKLNKFNKQRLTEQGQYFGGLSIEQTIEAGKKAKDITLGLLKGKKFTVITKWEMAPCGKRPHAYVVIEKNGKDFYLHEILTQAGLVRTKTRGAELPDDTDFYTQRDKIRAMEKIAKAAKRGAWGMEPNH